MPTKMAEMSSETRHAATNIFGKTAEQLREGVPEYAITEFITLNFRAPALIDNQSTPEGEAWAYAVRTYLSQQGRGPIWWGHDEGEWATIRLLVGELDVPIELDGKEGNAEIKESYS